MAPKVLLLVNSSPAGIGVGELFLSAIAGTYPAGRLVRYSTTRNAIGKSRTWLGFRSIERQVYVPAWPFLSSLAIASFDAFRAKKIAREISDLIVNEGIDVVWAVLSSAPTIIVAEELQRVSNVEMASSVLDDPRYFSSNQRLDPVCKARIMRSFSNVLRSSTRVSTVCEGMRKRYQSEFGVESILLRHGVDEVEIKKIKNVDSGQLRIGFAGSLYAKNEWNAFIDAIDACSGEVNGRQVSIEFVGDFPSRGARLGKFVRCWGRRSFAETMSILSKMDAAYLPTWFSRKQSIVRTTSFPGKLSAYAAADLPIFYHAPQDAAATEFFLKYPFAIQCDSLRPERIRRGIARITDAGFLSATSEAAAAAMKNELSREVMLDRFSELVGQRAHDPAQEGV